MLPSSLPRSRVLPSDAAPALRWGVLGTGWVAERFVTSLHRHTRQIPYAVGSRSTASADAFARANDAGTAYGSYAALLEDPKVDVVYVATPHNHHLRPALDAIAAGKHLVVEKPMAVDAAEAGRIVDAARAAGVFCMEALWTLFLPRYDVLDQLLSEGALGEPGLVLAELGEHFDDGHRIHRPELAGGPMLDLGTYAVTLATWVLGEPTDVVALSTPAPTGVDAQLGAVLRTDQGAMASLYASIRSATPTAATIAGTDAEVVLDGPFYQPGRFVARDHRGAELVWDEPAVSHDALHFQAAAAARDIAAGRTESSVRPHAGTLTTLRTMDRISAATAAAPATTAAPALAPVTP